MMAIARRGEIASVPRADCSFIGLVFSVPENTRLLTITGDQDLIENDGADSGLFIVGKPRGRSKDA